MEPRTLGDPRDDGIVVGILRTSLKIGPVHNSPWIPGTRRNRTALWLVQVGKRHLKTRFRIPMDDRIPRADTPCHYVTVVGEVEAKEEARLRVNTK